MTHPPSDRPGDQDGRGAARAVRAGDHVLHGPTGETWVVAWADPVTDDLAWCGWPDGMARLSDCTLVKAASDEEHQRTLRGVKASGGSRAAKAIRLYGEPIPTPTGEDGAVPHLTTETSR